MGQLRTILACVAALLAFTTTASAGIGVSPDTGAARAALGEVGAPYVFGGASPAAGFDSSGLVVWAYGREGIRLPHFTGALYELGTRIPKSRLRPGDLVFFYHAGHVGIYIGHGQFVHAPHTGATVAVARLGGSYAAAFTGAVRITKTK
jgi:peptidoglycan DL-endopeptidase CwlO